MITPGDIASKHFDKAMSGYRTGDVDSFLAEISGSMTQLGREIGSLKKKLEAAETQLKSYKEDEDSIRQALLNAQRLADNIVKDARNKADLTLRDAEIKAERIIEKSKGSVVAEQQEFDRIKDEVTLFRASLLKIYKAHLEKIDELPISRPELAYYDEPETQEAQPDIQILPEGIPQPEEAPHEAPAAEQQAGLKDEQNTPETAVAQAAATAAVTNELSQPLTGTAPKEQQPAEAFSAAEKQAAPAAQAPETTVPETAASPAQAEQQEVHINLQFNEKTGEYLPIGRQDAATRREMRYLDDDFLSGRSKRQRK